MRWTFMEKYYRIGNVSFNKSLSSHNISGSWLFAGNPTPEVSTETIQYSNMVGVALTGPSGGPPRLLLACAEGRKGAGVSGKHHRKGGPWGRSQIQQVSGVERAF